MARPRRLTALLVVAVALLIPSSASAFEPLLQFGTGAPGPGPGQLNNPAGVAVAPDGDVYVSEISNDRVSVFTPKGTFSRSFGGGHIDAPEGLAFGLDGNIYVTAVNTSLIAAFAPDGTFLRSFGGPGTGAGQIDTGGSIAVDPATGNLFVGDFFNNRIDVFTPAGGFLYAFGWDVIPGNGITVLEVCTTATGCKVGTGGGGVGQLDQPRQLAIDGIGNLFVVSETSQRVSVFSTAGGFARAFGWDVIPGGFAGLEVCTSMCQFGTFGGGAGQLGGPSGMTIDGAGGIYAVERDNDRVSQFSAQGGFIRAFGWDVIPGGTPGFEVCTATTTCKDGVPGGGFGQLGGPFFAGVDCRGSLYVADPGGSRVQKFGEPGVSDRSCLPNDFSFGKLKRNKRKGRATLTVNVPGAGALALSGKGLKPQRPGTHAVLSKSVSAAGKVKLLIKSKGRKRSKLKRTGKVKLKAHVTFTPTNGDPKSKTKGIKLRKRLTSKR